MQIRLIRYFLAIARERHFARAAQACHVSQPTLSAGLAALEAQLGKRLVERDRRFVGLTPEGEAVLPWAQQVVAASENMEQAAEAVAGPLRGELRFGAIPASMPVAGQLSRAVLLAHPGLTISLRSMTSRALERDLHGFEIDAGLTYLDHEPPANMLSVPLYTEHYLLVSRKAERDDPRTSVSWAEAAALPLTLLDKGMQNRRILDAILAERGIALTPQVTADSYIALLAMVQTGGYSTIIPNSHANLLAGIDWADIRPFDEPGRGSRIGLVVPDRSPLSALARIAIAVANGLTLGDDIDPL